MAQKQFRFAYNADDQLTSVSRSGTDGTSANVESKYGYDGTARLTTLEHTSAGHRYR